MTDIQFDVYNDQCGLILNQRLPDSYNRISSRNEYLQALRECVDQFQWSESWEIIDFPTVGYMFYRDEVVC